MPRPATAITIIMTTMTITLTEGGLYRLLAWLSPSFPVGAFSYSHGIEAAVEAGRVGDRASLESWVAAILRNGAGRIDADLLRDAWRAVGELRSKNPLPLSREPEVPAVASGKAKLCREIAGEGRVRAPDICADGAELRDAQPSPQPSPASGRGSINDELEALMEIAARADAHRGTAETALEARAQGEAFLATCRAAWPHPLLDTWAEALADEQRAPSYAVAIGVAAACAGVPLAAALTAYLHGVAANLVSAGLRLIPLGQTDGQRALQALAPVVAACVAASLGRSAADFGGCAFAAELASIDHETQYTRLFRS
jgi:urease accessory protein